MNASGWSKGASLVVDRERFLALVVVLAAPGCDRSSTVIEPAAAPLVIAPLDSPRSDGGVLVEEPVAAKQQGPEPSACEKENDSGDVDCSKLSKALGGPTCEGGAGHCRLLANGVSYRRRAAATAAACLSKLGARVCDIRARKQCYEEGVKSACPEPRFASACEEKMESCRRAGVRIQYTKEDCVRAMSAQNERDREWAISQMGPSSEGKCALMFTVF